MSRGYVPRLEGLEPRQVLDTSLAWPAAPVPAPAAPAGLAAALAPPLPGGLPSDGAGAVALGSDLPTPRPGPDGPAGKKTDPGGSYPDLQASQVDPATVARRDETLVLSLDALAGKLAATDPSRKGLKDARRAGTGGPLAGYEGPHPPAAFREGALDPAHPFDPALARRDFRSFPAGNQIQAPAHLPTHRPLPAPPAWPGPGPPLGEEGVAGNGTSLGGKDSPPAAAATGGYPADPLSPLQFDDLLALQWSPPAEHGSTAPPGQPAGGNFASCGGEGSHLPPLLLGVLPLPTGKPLDPVAEGYRYLCNYARTAIYAAERRAGPLSDHEDIVQQICLEWLQQAGPPDEAFPRLLEKSPMEMQLLRDTVSRVIARVIYQQRKDRRLAGLGDWPAPSRSAERDWVEFQSDCAQGVGHLTQVEWHILEQRRQGKTFAEIGAELGLARQRVWEVYHAVETRLRNIYRDAGG